MSTIVGDLALINNEPFVIRSINAEGDQWQVCQYDLPHTVEFQADYYSNLPNELIQEIALTLDLNSIQNLCQTSSKVNAAICSNEYFWKSKFIQDYGYEPSICLLNCF